MLFDFSMVIMFLALGAGFTFIALALGALIRPRRIVRARNATYECGETPIGQSWYNFNPRFYMTALVFLVFEVEVVVTYPVVTVLRQWAAAGRGWIAYLEILIFVCILFSGLIFLWAKGDLEWIKKLESREETL